jgi:Mrp family chromosome partitioning ATPase/capsular polysaccharide biosynthesis protein
MNEIRRVPKTTASHPRAEPRGEAEGALIVWDGIIGFLKRRKRTIGATMIAVLLVGVTALVLMPWNYKASVIIALNAYPAIPEQPNQHQQIQQTERMQREIQGLQSRALAAQVIQKLKLDQLPEFDPERALAGGIFARLGGLIGRSPGPAQIPTGDELADLRRSAVVDLFMQRLTVTPILTAEQIQITFASRDPRTAYRVANAVVDTYISTAMGTRGETLQKAADALQDRIASVKDELRDLPVSAGGALERQLEAKRALLQAYIQKLGELLLLKSAIEPRIFIQSRAVYPLQRAGLPLTLGIPFLAVAGFLLGLGVGLVQEGRQKTITNADQLEALMGLRVIGPPDGDTAAANRILNADPKRLARVAESIAMELLMARENARSAAVAFAAPSPSEAKSATCVEVARALARAGHRTLMIDATLRHSPAQARLSSKATREGAVAASVGAEPAQTFELRRDASHQLDILATGLDRDSGAADYEKVGNAVQRLTPDYGFVLIDLPPFGANPEARYLARFADFAVLVARRDHDHRGAVRAAVEQLNANGVHVIGAVLTRGTFERSAFSWVRDRLGLGS